MLTNVYHCGRMLSREKMRLDKETRKRLKFFKQAQKIQRKLNQGGTPEQRASWKSIMARAYRTFPTKAEEKMQAPLGELGFEAQVLLCGYIADFANSQHMIIVEIDGPIHDKKKVYDIDRDAVRSEERRVGK